MNRTILWSLLIILTLVAIWLLYAAGQYVDCLIAHRSGFFLLESRAAIHEACWLRLNPFYF